MERLTKEQFNSKMQDFLLEKDHMQNEVEQTMDADEHIEWNLLCYAAYDDIAGDFVNDNKVFNEPTYQDILDIIEMCEEAKIEKYTVYIEDRIDTHNKEGDYYPSENYATINIWSNHEEV